MESKVERRCPNCGYAYEDWVEICPDCGVKLSEGGERAHKERPSLGPGEDPKWTVVTNAPNAILGSFIKSQLEDAGIPVLMYRSRSADVGEFSHNDYVPHDLRVPKNRWEEARAIVDGRPDRPRSGAAWPEPAGPSNPYLPEGWTLHEGAGGTEQYGAQDNGWSVYRVDSAGADRMRGSPNGEEDSDEFDRAIREPDEYYERDYADEPVANQRLVKFFYAILLLAISLPFLLQLFAQIARIFQP